MKAFVFFIVVIVSFIGATFTKDDVVKFDGDQVISLNVTDEHQLSFLKYFEELQKIDLWSDNFALGELNLRIPKHSWSEFQELFLQRFNLKYRVVIHNLQELVDAETSEMQKKIIIDRYNRTNSFQFFDAYRNLDEINNWMSQMAENYPDRVSVITDFPTESYEKRKILGVKIGKKPFTNKPVLLFHGGIHAREWISPSTVSWIAHELMSKYESDAEIRRIVDSFEIHVFPVLNVDGYAFTHSSNRLWRKTRRKIPNSSCIGTDPNRNFPFQWATGGSSSNPCSETFHGDTKESEPEVKGMVAYGKRYADQGRLKGYIDYHAYGQLYMRPWGYSSRDVPADEGKMKVIGDSAAAAISRVRGKTYRSGRIAIIIYVASGSSADYFYGQHKVFSFAVELSTNFVLPVSEIKLCGNENFEGFKAFALKLLENLNL